MSQTSTRRLKIGILASVIIGLCVFPFWARPYLVEVAMIFFIWIILAQSYRLIVTIHDWQLYHVVLYGVGAYTSGMLAKDLGVPVFLAIPLGGVMACLFGVLITLILLRTTGWSFYIATYGLAELIRLTWLKFRYPFGGSTGIISIPYPPKIGGINFARSIPYYFFSLGIMLVILYLLYRIEISHTGNAFKAISMDPSLAASTGIDIPGTGSWLVPSAVFLPVLPAACWFTDLAQWTRRYSISTPCSTFSSGWWLAAPKPSGGLSSVYL